MEKKNFFRTNRIITLIAFWATVATAFAADINIVYLKNGSKVRGEIIEQIPNKSVTLETADGNIFVFDVNEIEKITRPKPAESSAENTGKAISPQPVSPSPQPASSSPQSVSSPKKEVSFGLRGGINFSKFYEKDAEEYYRSKTGFNVGAILDIPLFRSASNLSYYLQPGLYYMRKGMKGVDGDLTMKLSVGYLEVPVLFSFRVADLWQLNVGPYLAYGIHGSAKFEYDGKKIETDDIDVFGEPDDDNLGLKRFDAGICMSTGFQISKFYIGIQYDLGCINIANSDYDEEYNVNTGSFSIHVGVTF